MTRSSTRGFAALGAGVVAALLFAARAAVPTAAAAVTLPDPVVDQPIAAPAGQQTIVFAGGCFWGVQAVFQHVKGVVSATSGYAGGTVASPTYDDVSSGTTGHAESVRVVFDTSQVSLGQLLKVFFSVAHDPTELNRQGPDVGTQYRSAIFYTTPAQQKIVDAYIAQLKEAKAFREPIVTEVKPLRAFYQAEDYHQNYYNLHPNSAYIVINDRPKVEALKRDFASLWKS
ncbi:MAG: peptide-methionine (S)-S-oxide reductase MsrA [Gemmatimonadetes bacterium]|nr:peptide-methionine (S)-S-oxide reductase MsrA [Gemmatimonadota bacterium]